ncbi:hypothetical protein BH09BAC6_BH09BAC6_00320 [soil metagenome]
MLILPIKIANKKHSSVWKSIVALLRHPGNFICNFFGYFHFFLKFSQIKVTFYFSNVK